MIRLFAWLVAWMDRRETFTKCPRCGYASPTASMEEQYADADKDLP